MALRANRLRPFTAISLLLWIVIPTIAVDVHNRVVESYKRSDLPDPASLDAAFGSYFFTVLMLLLLIATLQWLILRRTWPDIWWLAWFLVVFVSSIMTLALLRTSQPIVIILAFGLAPSVVLSLASQNSLRLLVFMTTLVFFSSGAALVWFTQNGEFILHRLSYPLTHFFAAHPEASCAFSTAVSGFGLWLVSGRICRHEASLPTAG